MSESAARTAERRAVTASLRWSDSLSAPPVVGSDATGWSGALLRRWAGTAPVMEQPPLDHHYLVMHLGGPKHVDRRLDGARVSKLVEDRALTLVPQGTQFSWTTRGPIAFAHLYLRPDQFAATLARDHDREGRDHVLIDRVGCQDRILGIAMAGMLEEIANGPSASALKLDCLLETVLIQLIDRHSSRIRDVAPQAVALAPWRLRRVLDFIDAELGADIGLADLAAAAGSSQFHFSRAFALATGHSPYQYLLRKRLQFGRVLLASSEEPLPHVARRCGFRSTRQFGAMFRKSVGIGPKRFRLERRIGGGLRGAENSSRMQS